MWMAAALVARLRHDRCLDRLKCPRLSVSSLVGRAKNPKTFPVSSLPTREMSVGYSVATRRHTRLRNGIEPCFIIHRPFVVMRLHNLFRFGHSRLLCPLVRFSF